MKIPSFVYILIAVIVSAAFLIYVAINRQDDLTQREQELADIAESLGMDATQFEEDFKGDEVRDFVDSQREDVVERLNGEIVTPTVYIEGVKVNNDTFENFSNTIDSFLESREDQTKPILIESFVDYTCPACAAFDIVLYQVEDVYGDQVIVEHKHLPFRFDASYTYAYAAEAARRQGKFDEMHANIFNYAQPENYDFEGVIALIEKKQSTDLDSSETVEEGTSGDETIEDSVE